MRLKVKVSIDMYDLRGEGIHAFAPAFVSGIPIRMLIDTGASKTVFDLNFIKDRLSHILLTPADEAVHGFVAGHNTLYTATLPDVYFNTIGLYSPQVRLLDLAYVNDLYKQFDIPPIQGIIGSDWLHNCKAIIDYSTQKLKMKIPVNETPETLLNIHIPDTEE